MKTLVIGDPHTEPNQDLTRFYRLGDFIINHKPDNIVMMGDFLTLDSLSAFDKNKAGKMEGRRFKAELVAGATAMDSMMLATKEYNNDCRSKKKKQYVPNKYFLEGNHEDRWFRFLDVHPELKDSVDIYKEIGVYDYGWDLVKYRDYVHIDGVLFTHVPMNGINRPISGVRVMDHALAMHELSIVFGHTHDLQFKTLSRHGVSHTQTYALNCGWFGEDVPEYAIGSLGHKNWWSGVIMLEHTGHGKFTFDTYGVNDL